MSNTNYQEVEGREISTLSIAELQEAKARYEAREAKADEHGKIATSLAAAFVLTHIRGELDRREAEATK